MHSDCFLFLNYCRLFFFFKKKCTGDLWATWQQQAMANKCGSFRFRIVLDPAPAIARRTRRSAARATHSAVAAQAARASTVCRAARSRRATLATRQTTKSSIRAPSNSSRSAWSRARPRPPPAIAASRAAGSAAATAYVERVQEVVSDEKVRCQSLW